MGNNLGEILIALFLFLAGLGVLIFGSYEGEGDAITQETILVEPPVTESKTNDPEKVVLTADPEFDSNTEANLYEQRVIIDEQIQQVDDLNTKLDGIIEQLEKEKQEVH